MPITLTRQEMEEKLAQVFPPEQSASLVEVLDEIRAAEIERAADTRELKQGLTALTKEVRQLAEAQRRTDERLAAFQQRTDERFAELGQMVGVLAESVQGLQQAVGGLANRFGFDSDNDRGERIAAAGWEVEGCSGDSGGARGGTGSGGHERASYSRGRW